MLYLIRCIKPDWHQIAKFGDHNVPEDVYDVISGTCNCPGGYRGNCKHHRMLAAWKSYVAKAPPYSSYAYDDARDDFVALPFGDKDFSRMLERLGYSEPTKTS